MVEIVICARARMRAIKFSTINIHSRVTHSSYIINYFFVLFYFSKDNLLFSKLFQDLVNECLLIKQIILPVVCNASPEGYLPDCNDSSASSSPSSVVLCYNNQNSEASSSKSQMILFYAWRTMKEMTLLLAEICKQAITLQHTIALLNEQHLIDIGEFFVELFILSKHRGVFEQAFVGFSIVCERFWKLVVISF